MHIFSSTKRGLPLGWYGLDAVSQAGNAPGGLVGRRLDGTALRLVAAAAGDAGLKILGGRLS